jgi:hypothetical protein
MYMCYTGAVDVRGRRPLITRYFVMKFLSLYMCVMIISDHASDESVINLPLREWGGAGVMI